MRPCRRASRCEAERASSDPRPAELPTNLPAKSAFLGSDRPSACCTGRDALRSVPLRMGSVDRSRRPFVRAPVAREAPEGLSSSDCGIPSPGPRSARAGTTPSGTRPGVPRASLSTPSYSVTVHQSSSPDPRFTATPCQLQDLRHDRSQVDRGPEATPRGRMTASIPTRELTAATA